MAKVFKKFGKIKWRKLIAGVLVIAAIAGCVGGAVALFGKQTKTISASEFSVGDIGEDGKPKDSSVAIYTKDAFACDGLQIIPDFEAKCSYRIFYYDAKDAFVSSTEKMTEAYEGVNPEADHARVVIYPEVPSDWDEDKEFKIRFWEVREYAKQLKITVSRDQLEYKTISVNLMSGKDLSEGAFSKASLDTLDANSLVKSTPIFTFDSAKYDYYRVYVMVTEKPETNVTVAFGDAKNDENGSFKEYTPMLDSANDFAYTINGADMSINTWYSITVKTPKGADAFRVMGPDTAVYRIYGMNQ